MNLNALTTQAMLVQSDRWLHNPEVHAALMKYALGIALKPQLVVSYEQLSLVQASRGKVYGDISALSARIVEVDQDFDDGARCLFFGLEALIAGARDQTSSTQFTTLRDLLFPDGLSIIQRSFVDEGGAMLEIERRVTPEILRALDAIRLGDRTLGAVYRDWVAAGAMLRELTQKRAQVRASAARGGTALPAIDGRNARQQWIKTVHALLGAFELENLSDATRELLFGPLYHSVALATRGGQAEDDDSELPEVDEAPVTEAGSQDSTGTSPEPQLAPDMLASLNSVSVPATDAR